MNPKYDHSIYTDLKIVNVLDPRFDDSNLPHFFPGWHKLRHHESISQHFIYPEFLYNQQDTSKIKYGKTVLMHYKKHPVEKQFTHVENAIQTLFDTYNLEGEKTKESDIYLATKAFLTLLGTDTIFKCKPNGSISKSQLALVVPTEFKRDDRFIEEVLRPLFIEAGYASKVDRRSKLLFFSVLEAVLFAQQQYSMLWPEDTILAITREKKYLNCRVQVHYDNSISLQLDEVHMKYDKHFIAASKSAISFSENELLAPYFEVSSGKTIHIPNCVSRTTLELPRFILSRVFADSAYKISFKHGDLLGFYLNGEYMAGDYFENFMDQLLPLLEKQIEEFADLSQFVDISICQELGIWEHLNQNERINFASLTYEEILEFMPQIDAPFVLHEIKSYAKKHDCMPHSADDIMLTINNNFLRRRNESSKMQGIFARYQQARLVKAIHSLTRDDRSFDFDFTANFAICKGVLFKILTMIELSNRLEEPIIVSSYQESGDLEPVTGRAESNALKIIKSMPEYQFYVEAKITTDHCIKLYLHQVIATQNGKEKSTLPITETVIKFDNIHNVVCDIVWSRSQEHLSFNCASALCTHDHYRNFRSFFLPYLYEMFKNEEPADKDIHDLHDIHIGGSECSCCIQFSHYMILNMGVKHYLKEIAQSITGCVKSPATFGKYKVQSVIITGSLLSAWMKLQNKLCREFIWRQLNAELLSSLHQQQLHIQLMMSEKIIALFPDEEFIKWEKYQQVVGQKRLLVDIERAEIPAKLYEDKGDRYELIPSIEINGEEHWRYLLTPKDNTILEQTGITKRLFIKPEVLDEKSDPEDSDEEDYLVQYYRIGVYVYYPQEQHQIGQSHLPLNEEALIIQSSLIIGSTGQSFRDEILSTNFPLILTQKPQNYSFRSVCSLDSNYFHSDTAFLPERMNLM